MVLSAIGKMFISHNYFLEHNEWEFSVLIDQIAWLKTR